jgi:hypothetical protein
MVRTITGEIKREGEKRANKGQKMNNPHEFKKGRKLVPFVGGNNLTHDPSNVAYMQIMNLMGGLEHTSLANTIFFSIEETKTRSRAILTCCLKN